MNAEQPAMTGGKPASTTSVLAAANEAFRASREQLAALLELATLEARYSVLMLAAVVGLAVVVALTGVGAWGLLCAAAIAGLTASGWSLGAALAVLGVAHCGAGLAAWLILRRCLVRVGMDSTREALGLATNDVSP
jgi:hypothetical protein